MIKANRVHDVNSLRNPGDFRIDVLHPPSNLRELTAEEEERYAGYEYVKYESYQDGIVIGRFWTQKELDATSTGPIVTGITFCCPCGCGGVSVIKFISFINGVTWNWDGNEDQPTCTPSIQRLDSCRWHGYLTKGEFVTC